MKFGQLIDRNMRNIFLEKSYKNAIEILFPDPFLKNQNCAYLWANILKFQTACVWLHLLREIWRNICNVTVC